MCKGVFKPHRVAGGSFNESPVSILWGTFLTALLLSCLPTIAVMKQTVLSYIHTHTHYTYTFNHINTRWFAHSNFVILVQAFKLKYITAEQQRKLVKLWPILVNDTQHSEAIPEPQYFCDSEHDGGLRDTG
jgi:hypothetical protein